MYRIGFIGVGNMGGTLARAVCKTAPAESVLVCDVNEENTAALARETGCVIAESLQIAAQCDIIFIGVKPVGVDGVLRELDPALMARTKTPVVVSMAAGVTLADLSARRDGPIIRMMPNTPAALGAGMILASRGSKVTDEQFSDFKRILSAAGQIDEIDESLMDAAGALSGCGPAFVYLFIEALADGGTAVGLPRAKAQRYAAQTVLGAAKMVLETGLHPGQLKDAVCSAGGTTIAGVTALENGAFRAAAINAVKAAFDRTAELKK